MESSNTYGGTTWGLVRSIAQELSGIKLQFFTVVTFFYMLDMSNIRLHIVDVGCKEDMKILPVIISSNLGENECMIRNNELFVSRLLPVEHTKETNVNDTIIYPYCGLYVI